ncbi:hypothetical protein KAU34_05390 [candidate division WOR-3 bacterium]|nr:hypothetical protein [candidate division WOR-3 bacterium]
MMLSKKLFFKVSRLVVFLLILLISGIFAQETDLGLINENMLHPLDSFTGYTFNKGEWAYNQAITPCPSWACWGITDWLTTEFDFECWLGGVPSFNFRFALSKQHGIHPALAYETMFQYIFKEINLLEGYDSLRVVRKGSSWYNRINASWRLSEQIRLHLSLGSTYAKSILIENYNRPEYSGKYYKELLSPDLSLGFDWRIAKWLSFHSAGSYGTTFIYLDNVPRKYQFTYGFRIAPFLKSQWSILGNFRVELSSIFFYFPEAKETVSMPIPIFPYFYWQWGG